MTFIANRSLRWANQDYQKANDEWRIHMTHCPSCTVAARRRRYESCCTIGLGFRENLAAAKAVLADEREAAKEPNPDQEELF